VKLGSEIQQCIIPPPVGAVHYLDRGIQHLQHRHTGQLNYQSIHAIQTKMLKSQRRRNAYADD
jgi:hypothetical protein